MIALFYARALMAIRLGHLLLEGLPGIALLSNKHSLFDYLRTESGDTDSESSDCLSFVRTALMGGEKYWLWKYSAPKKILYHSTKLNTYLINMLP